MDSEQKGRGGVGREEWITDNRDVQNIVEKNDGEKNVCVRAAALRHEQKQTHWLPENNDRVVKVPGDPSLFVCLLKLQDSISETKYGPRKTEKRLNWKNMSFCQCWWGREGAECQIWSPGGWRRLSTSKSKMEANGRLVPGVVRQRNYAMFVSAPLVWLQRLGAVPQQPDGSLI